MLLRIDHVGLAVHDLDEAVAFHERTYGLRVRHTEVNEEQGVREAMLHVVEGTEAAAGASYVQLLEPLSPDTPVGRFLARRGEGVHHVGYGVADVAAAMERLAASGVRLLDERPRHGSMGAAIAFLHPKDTHGVLTEIVQASTRHREPGAG